MSEAEVEVSEPESRVDAPEPEGSAEEAERRGASPDATPEGPAGTSDEGSAADSSSAADSGSTAVADPSALDAHARRAMLRTIRRRVGREPALVAELRPRSEAEVLREEIVPTLDLLDHWIERGVSDLGPRSPEVDGWSVPGKQVEVSLRPRGTLRLWMGEDADTELLLAMRVVVPALAAGNRVEWVVPTSRGGLATTLRALFRGFPVRLYVGDERAAAPAEVNVALGHPPTGATPLDLHVVPELDAAWVLESSSRALAGIAWASSRTHGRGRLRVVLASDAATLEQLAHALESSGAAPENGDAGEDAEAGDEGPAESLPGTSRRGRMLIFDSLDALGDALAADPGRWLHAEELLCAVAPVDDAGGWLAARAWFEVSVWSRNLIEAERCARRLGASRLSVNDHVGQAILPELPEAIDAATLGDPRLALFTRPVVLSVDAKRGLEPRWQSDLAHARSLLRTRARGRLRALASSARLALRALRS